MFYGQYKDPDEEDREMAEDGSLIRYMIFYQYKNINFKCNLKDLQLKLRSANIMS